MSLNKPIWKLRDWIDNKNLCHVNLCRNPKALDFIKNNKIVINWYCLSSNETAIELLLENVDKIDWNQFQLNTDDEAIKLMKKHINKINKINLHNLCRNSNPKAIELLIEQSRFINNIEWFIWQYISRNPAGIDIILKNPDNINWRQLSNNPSPIAIELLKKNPEKIDWYELSANRNPDAMDILITKPNEIVWYLLSGNPNPKAIKILSENKNKIDWVSLSGNPNAIELLKANPDKINWSWLCLNSHPEAIELLKQNQDKIVYRVFSKNPSIFELDYEAMRINNREIEEELIKEVMKPYRVFKNPDYDYIEELFGD